MAPRTQLADAAAHDRHYAALAQLKRPEGTEQRRVFYALADSWRVLAKQRQHGAVERGRVIFVAQVSDAV